MTYEDAESVRLVVEQQGAEPPIGIRIEELTTTSARVTWEPDDASMTYILGVAERSVIDSYASGREMMEHDLEGFKADADSWGMSLSEYLEFGVLYHRQAGISERRIQTRNRVLRILRTVWMRTASLRRGGQGNFRDGGYDRLFLYD